MDADAGVTAGGLLDRGWDEGRVRERAGRPAGPVCIAAVSALNGAVQVYVALDFLPAARPRPFGRPGPACLFLCKRNSSVTPTPNALAILTRDLTVRFSPPPSIRWRYLSVKPRRSDPA